MIILKLQVIYVLETLLKNKMRILKLVMFGKEVFSIFDDGMMNLKIIYVILLKTQLDLTMIYFFSSFF
jgi:hypothetical protein